MLFICFYTTMWGVSNSRCRCRINNIFKTADRVERNNGLAAQNMNMDPLNVVEQLHVCIVLKCPKYKP